MRGAMFAAMGGAIVALAVGCGEAPNAGGANKNVRTIAVIPKGTLHDFWKSIHAGAVKAEKELGDVEVIWQGPAREDDRGQQIAIVENFINRRVDAIVLAPLDRNALAPYVEQAMEKKIPVVIIDSGIDTENIISYVATNNYNGGALAAKYLGEQLGGKGNVILLRYQENSESTEQREKGFLETLTKNFPDIKILSDEQYSGATREGALSKSENLLARFPDQIDGWFCPCEPVTYGVLQAVENKGVPAGRIKIVGFDAGADVVAALRAGKISGLVLQDPVQMGYLGVKTALDHLQGKEVPRRVDTGETIVTRENMDEPAMKQLHSPDLGQWLDAGADAKKE